MRLNFVLQSSLLTSALLLSGCLRIFDKPGTSLAEAAHRGDVSAIRTLVAAGAEVDAFGPDGQTALHWAVRGGHSLGPHRCTGETAERLVVVAALLDVGADPNLVDRRPTLPIGGSGWTPLHLAIGHEQFKTATLLLERGADPNILSQQGRSVLAFAANERAPKDLLQLILTSGFDAQMARRPERR